MDNYLSFNWVIPLLLLTGSDDELIMEFNMSRGTCHVRGMGTERWHYKCFDSIKTLVDSYPQPEVIITPPKAEVRHILSC